jgi:hypothetical protein
LNKEQADLIEGVEMTNEEYAVEEAYTEEVKVLYHELLEAYTFPKEDEEGTALEPGARFVPPEERFLAGLANARKARDKSISLLKGS